MTKQQLIEDNINLVYHTIRKYYPTFIYDEDIVQCGMVGLCNAVQKWDKEKSTFSTYAAVCICNEIKNEFCRRNKHNNVLSLDYDHNEDSKDGVTLKELLIGDSDVPYVDLDSVYRRLNKEERTIIDLALQGLYTSEIGKRIGRSHEFVSGKIRKFKALWRIVNKEG